MAEPTDVQLKEYAAQLPRIYKLVLEAFAKADEARRYGEALPDSDITQWVTLHDGLYRTEDTRIALQNLAVRGILNRNSEEEGSHTWFSFTPTNFGERLISVLTGRLAPKDVVPELPEFAWN